MGVKVCKFGGSSLASAERFAKVKAIVEADPERRFIVASAPGKWGAFNRKVTDLLLLCQEHAAQDLPFDDVWKPVEERYLGIVRDLGLDLDLAPALAEVREGIAGGATRDWAASRGEHLNARVLAAYLDFPFIDASETVRFLDGGVLDLAETKRLMRERLNAEGAGVVPGFYGATKGGEIRVFSRGGSDISGSLVAAGAGAAVYENWTDVPGLLMADPRVVDAPKPIARITFRELRELSYMGAVVLHDEALFPLRGTEIPVHIRSVDQPDAPGTLIEREASAHAPESVLSGIAGRKDFTVIAMDKALMNQERGFGRRVLRVLEDHGVSYEHTPTGIDSMSLVVASSELEGKLGSVVEAIEREVRPDHLEVHPEMALIAVVGRGMAHRPGVAAKVFTALAAAGVNVRMIDQGSSEINIILGVNTADFEAAVRAIYAAFVTSTG